MALLLSSTARPASLLSGVKAIAPILSRKLIRSQAIDPERF
jgi:hypothetical protein